MEKQMKWLHDSLQVPVLLEVLELKRRNAEKRKCTEFLEVDAERKQNPGEFRKVDAKRRKYRKNKKIRRN